MKKRGISTIVATVLIVLITVAAVTILWTAISPLIEIDDTTGCFNIQDAVTIDADKTYTCVNRGANVTVRIERAANSDELEGLELILTEDGSTIGRMYNDSDEIPSENGAEVYTMWTSTNANSEVTLSVAPQILADGENSSCTATPPIVLKDC